MGSYGKNNESEASFSGSLESNISGIEIQPAEALRVEGVSKSFGGQAALRDVSLSISAGEVHALVGHNGAGKSTLMGIISGQLAPDHGHVLVNGTPIHLGDPRVSRAAGIACIYQQLTMVPALSACENVFLGQTLKRYGKVSTSAMRARFTELCDSLGVSIDPSARSGRLSVAQQQLLEIMRGLQAGATVILLDEPTASLPVSERDHVYAIMAALRAAGKAIILVSHQLREVLMHSERVTVLRDGVVIKTAPVETWTEDALIESMAGERQNNTGIRLRSDSAPRNTQPPLLEIHELDVPSALNVSNIQVQPGEILGLAGLIGSGRTTLLRALAGLEPRARGAFTLAGKSGPLPKNPREAITRGIALIPEDRRTALVMGLPIWDNIGMGPGAKGEPRFVITRRHRQTYATDSMTESDFDLRRLGEPIRNLSGGNQQKVLLAKWAARNPQVLLADEPTQGIDVMAKTDLLLRIRDLADSGKAVIVASSEIDELLSLADRILVLNRGQVTANVRANEPAWNEDDILRFAFKTTPMEETVA